MALTLTYIGANTSGTNATTYDFGNFTAASDGLMIVFAGGRSASAHTLSSISIGGSAGSLVGGGASAIQSGAIGYRVVSAGANNVTVTFSAGILRAGVQVYLLTGYASATPYDSDVQTGNSPLTATLDFPANGVAVYGALSNGAAGTTWSAASEDADTTITDNVNANIASAHKTASGAGNTETATKSTVEMVLSAAVWEPAAASSGNPHYYYQNQAAVAL